MAQKVWLITGTSCGFGRRLVDAVLERGDRVVASARTLDGIADLARDANLHRLQLDIAAGTEVVRVQVAAAAAVWGRLDVVVNNAGMGLPGMLEEGGVDRLAEQYRTNVFGTMDVTTAALPYMREQKSGTVVLIGSRSAWRTEVAGLGYYASSKAALHAIGETLAVELAQFGIRVLIVAPGAFRTEGAYRHAFAAPRPIADYDAARTRIAATWHDVAGRQPGDPAKAMRAVVDVVRGEGQAAGRPWPLYLALGRDAERDIRNKCARVLGHLDEWADVVRAVELGEEREESAA